MVDDVEAHLRAFFDGHAIHARTWSPRHAIRVLVIAPGPRTPHWTYASLGASLHGLELFLLAPTEDYLHVELVTMAASYHVDADASYRLDVGHTVPIGRPWLPGAFKIEHGLDALEARFEAAPLRYWDAARAAVV